MAFRLVGVGLGDPAVLARHHCVELDVVAEAGGDDGVDDVRVLALARDVRVDLEVVEGVDEALLELDVLNEAGLMRRADLHPLAADLDRVRRRTDELAVRRRHHSHLQLLLDRVNEHLGDLARSGAGPNHLARAHRFERHQCAVGHLELGIAGETEHVRVAAADRDGGATAVLISTTGAFTLRSLTNHLHQRADLEVPWVRAVVVLKEHLVCRHERAFSPALQVGVGLVDRVDAVLAKRVHGLINVGQVCPAVPAAAGELDRDVPGGQDGKLGDRIVADGIGSVARNTIRVVLMVLDETAMRVLKEEAALDVIRRDDGGGLRALGLVSAEEHRSLASIVVDVGGEEEAVALAHFVTLHVAVVIAAGERHLGGIAREVEVARSEAEVVPPSVLVVEVKLGDDLGLGCVQGGPDGGSERAVGHRGLAEHREQRALRNVEQQLVCGGGHAVGQVQRLGAVHLGLLEGHKRAAWEETGARVDHLLHHHFNKGSEASLVASLIDDVKHSAGITRIRWRVITFHGNVQVLGDECVKNWCELRPGTVASRVDAEIPVWPKSAERIQTPSNTVGHLENANVRALHLASVD
mmetsp:Transcript_1490/g.2949  ORF Transcript_1490/g.2949 Transcript_1490/m.2949 type:complete len:582 (-) Transcript_1490:506-2251(-)